MGVEGLLLSLPLLVLPFIILAALIRILPAWEKPAADLAAQAAK